MQGDTLDFFNMKKLSSYIKDYQNVKVLICGVGAVGSKLAEQLIQMGVIHIDMLDLDKLELDNLAKSSGLFKKEDIGKNKAICLSDRCNEVLNGLYTHGMDLNVCTLGPMALKQYDVVFLALDNFAAKLYVNQIWKQVPTEDKPLLISGGTFLESAQSNCFDGTGPCLRCGISEDWIKNPFVRTSCTGMKLRNNVVISDGPVQTSGLASTMAAILMAGQTAPLVGLDNHMQNKVSMFSGFPNMNIDTHGLTKRKDCPDCEQFLPVKNAIALPGMDVLHTSVGELIDKVGAQLATPNFEIMVPKIVYGNQTYNQLICNEYCRVCGRKMTELYFHEFRTWNHSLICKECRESDKKIFMDAADRNIGTTMAAITKDTCTDTLAKKTLYEIGTRVGGFIQVYSKPEGWRDVMDGPPISHVFYCEGDGDLLRNISRLEE